MFPLRMLQARLRANRQSTRSLIASLRSENLTYVGGRKLRRLAESVELIKLLKVRGAMLEAGVALGGSAILLAKLRTVQTPLFLYDTFGMIPPPSERDDQDAHERYRVINSGRSEGLGGELYYGYRSDLIDEITENFRRFGLDARKDLVKFVQGEFSETLYPDQPIALAHIDCDWYASVVTCIERIFPCLATGGVMVFDDYGSYSGCKKAVDEFLSTTDGVRVLFMERSVGVQKR